MERFQYEQHLSGRLVSHCSATVRNKSSRKTCGMDAGLVINGSPSVAQSKHSLHIAHLRNRLVWSQSLLSWAAFLSGFYLAANSLEGSQYFLITGLLFSAVASVTATCERVSIQDLPRIGNITEKK